MDRWARCTLWAFLLVVVSGVVLAPDARAGIGDAIKKKSSDATRKATEKAEAEIAGEEKKEPAETEATAASAPAGGGSVSTVSTKFDYVPGDSVLFLDDFTQDELGEFPQRWSLKQGTFEVAEMEGERWLRCVSVDGVVRMKLPEMQHLPEFWTPEFEFYATEPMGSALTVTALSSAEGAVWLATYPQGQDLAFRSGEFFSTTTLEGSSIGGRHRVMFMARGKGIKAYIDRQRLASVPEYSGTEAPASLEFRLWASTHPMITNVRFAEGCRPPKDMLAEGKLVTHGIFFATGSDAVMPESAPVLRQIASYMESNPAVKLAITGHTDNVGSAASNLDLSKRRAASVARVLSGELGVAADRLASDGKGDTEPMSSNAKPEGRAMNRRVEFAKQLAN